MSVRESLRNAAVEAAAVCASVVGAFVMFSLGLVATGSVSGVTLAVIVPFSLFLGAAFWWIGGPWTVKRYATVVRHG